MVFPDPLHKFQPGPAQVEIARKGGSVGGPKKRLAAKIRELKRKGINDETVEWLYNALESDEMSMYQALVVVRSVVTEARSIKEREMAARLLLDFHKIRHGTKESHKKIDVTNREIHFVIETSNPGVPTNAVDNTLEANGQTAISVQLPERR
jgi:hypothetical protein